MCELFAVSSSFPACVNMCLQEFQQHGGNHNKVTDGWGMAFYEGNDARIIREAEAAYQSQHMDFIRDYASHVKGKGIFSFLYCDGEYLFVHSHKRTQPDGEIKPPGLYVLTRQGHHDSHRDIPGVKLQCEHDQPDMALVASMPLTGEDWQPLPTQTITVLHQGRVKESYPL
jgi:predicted glutamine amidotransferase